MTREFASPLENGTWTIPCRMWKASQVCQLHHKHQNTNVLPRPSPIPRPRRREVWPSNAKPLRRRKSALRSATVPPNDQARRRARLLGWHTRATSCWNAKPTTVRLSKEQLYRARQNSCRLCALHATIPFCASVTLRLPASMPNVPRVMRTGTASHRRGCSPYFSWIQIAKCFDLEGDAFNCFSIWIVVGRPTAVCLTDSIHLVIGWIKPKSPSAT